MNPHLNVFLNYKEKEADRVIENNLTRAFIITLKNEPQLLQDLFFLIDKENTWDEISVSIQERSINISGFEKIIGVTLTAESISEELIKTIEPRDTKTPTPDFLIYTSKTLIVGEVKKSSENAIAQVKNQVDYLIRNAEEKRKIVTEFKSISWTEILNKLILPHLKFHERNQSRTIWPSEFKDYIATHYTDWLPTPTLDNINFNDKESITNQFIEKRLYAIQALTRFSPPQWIGNRMTMPIDFKWATEAQVKREKYNGKDFICITIWPADTKAQGNILFSKNLKWIYSN